MIDKKLALVPHSPGCYLMKNKDGIIIYVGKSKNLKNRLSSYFKSSHTGKTKMLVRDIYDFEYILTSSELESLLLEINLIKKHSPKYNVLLRDDKTYPYIEITNEKYFRLLVVRNPNIKKRKDTKLFGPYPNVKAARTVTDLINRIYPLKKCKHYEKKECLYYHIGECLGYCTKQIDEEKLNKMKSEIISFLNGNSDIIINKVTKLMEESSEKMQYEKALEYKNLLEQIKITLERQKVEVDDNINRDVIGYYTDGNYIAINILHIRGGKLLDSTNNIFPVIDTIEEELNLYITKFYDKHNILPKEVIISNNIDESILTKIFNIKFYTPIKGSKKKILELSNTNAKNYFNEQMTIIAKDEKRTITALEELQTLLNIKQIRRIELFDNSNLFGTFNVSGMAVFIDGLPAKNEYRKFKITNQKNDDYGTMREVIYRRYFRVLKDKLERPDLIIVDGGLGQLNVAKEVLQELYLDIPIASLKKNDKHQTSELLGLDPIQTIKIDKKSNLFLLLTKMQDEVHNYTISYHKQIRSKSAIDSHLDNIEGIGEKRKKQLQKKYKSLSKIKEASIEQLEEILPKSVAENLLEYLNNIDKYKEEL